MTRPDLASRLPPMPHRVRFGSRDLEPDAPRYSYQGCQMTAQALAYCLGGPVAAWKRALKRHGTVLSVLIAWPERERLAADQRAVEALASRDAPVRIMCGCGAEIKTRSLAAKFGAARCKSCR